MKSRILLLSLSLSLVFLSGCVREESPLWYMTSSDKEIDLHFKKTCLDYGYQTNTSELDSCIKQERKSSASEANNRLYQVGQLMEQMDTQRIQNHNRAVDRMNQKSQRVKVYDPSGQFRSYSQNGNWYSANGEYAGFIKNNNIYGTDGKYIGYKRNNNYYNADGTYAGREN